MPYMFSCDSIWQDQEQDSANLEWTRDCWERMQRHSDRGRMYLNFPGLGEEGDVLLRRSYGANYHPLTQIKKKYDPDNVFRFNQNIAPPPADEKRSPITTSRRTP
jgi:FAD/FMN-containing dehydrogenase